MGQPTALDPMWMAEDDDADLIDLRLHITRLCLVADELRVRCNDDGWAAVSENLHLAASLRNLQADTDLMGNNYLCSSAADYDEALSMLSERHLAGVIVFNLCWNAYEGAVELASPSPHGRRPKGALGREILRGRGDAHFPWLRKCLAASLQFISPDALSSPEAKAMVSGGLLTALAAEVLRYFRNEVAHGTIRRPEPEDWGSGSRYIPDQDPEIRQFAHHVRLLLLVTQVMMLETDAQLSELSRITDGWSPARDVLTVLHCKESQAEDEHQLTLDLGREEPAFSRY